MKKFFTLIAAALMAVSANARVSLAAFTPWGATCTVDGTTYTFDGSWSGGSTWLMNGDTPYDAEGYDYFVVTYSNHTGANLNVSVFYNDIQGVESWGAVYASGSAAIDQESGYAAVPLDKKSMDDTGKIYINDIRQVNIQDAGEAGSVTIDGIYFMTSAELEEEDVPVNQAEQLTLANLSSGWDASYDATTKTISFEGDWKGRGWWFNSIDYSAYDEVVVKFAEPVSGYCQLCIEYNSNQQNSDGTNTMNVAAEILAGSTEIVVPLNAEGKNSIKQIYIVNGEGVTSVVLSEAFVCTKSYYTTTAISEVAAPAAAQKVVKSVKNGKVVIVKDGAEYNVAGQLVK